MKYKKIFVFFLLFLTIGRAPAQKPGIARQTPLSTYRSVTIRLPGIKDSGKEFVQAPGFFHHFEIIDDRMDTARIGVHADQDRAVNTHNRQLAFARPASVELANYLNARYSNPRSSCAALLVIRTLWLSDASYVREDMVKDPDKRLDKTKIRLRVEVYAAKEGIYTPLFRYDSLSTSQKVSYKQFGRDLAGMLDELADSSTLTAARKWATGRKLSLEDIRLFNQSRSDLAICRNGPPRKGVYKDFSEFRDNNPSITDYEIKKEKGNMYLYLNEGDHSYYSHNAWGFCDGANVFIMKDGSLNPAWKEGKAWYMFGEARIEEASSRRPGVAGAPDLPSAGPAIGFGSIGASGLLQNMIYTLRNYNEMHVFLIDMDTGALY